jgi:hypothetical protein
VNIPYLLAKETSVVSSEIKETKATFCLKHTNSLPGNQSCDASSNISSPHKVSANTNDIPHHNFRDGKNI